MDTLNFTVPEDMRPDDQQAEIVRAVAGQYIHNALGAIEKIVMAGCRHYGVCPVLAALQNRIRSLSYRYHPEIRDYFLDDNLLVRVQQKQNNGFGFDFIVPAEINIEGIRDHAITESSQPPGEPDPGSGSTLPAERNSMLRPENGSERIVPEQAGGEEAGHGFRERDGLGGAG